VNEAVERVIKCFEPSQLIIAPFLLFSGFVEERIKAATEETANHYSIPLIYSNPLGIHPLVIEIAKERIQECLEGKATMSCDLCKYRIPIKGYENQVGQAQISHHFHP
jgi:sirohydrochlorin cobaltochelatase